MQPVIGSALIKSGDALQRKGRTFAVFRPEGPFEDLLRGVVIRADTIREIDHKHQDIRIPDRGQRRIDGLDRRRDQLRIGHLNLFIDLIRPLAAQDNPFEQRQVADIQRLILVEIGTW